ncbi:unnamed protein product, partial [Staurois parvus]
SVRTGRGGSVRTGRGGKCPDWEGGGKVSGLEGGGKCSDRKGGKCPDWKCRTGRGGGGGGGGVSGQGVVLPFLEHEWPGGVTLGWGGPGRSGLEESVV